MKSFDQKSVTKFIDLEIEFQEDKEDKVEEDTESLIESQKRFQETDEEGEREEDCPFPSVENRNKE